MKKQIAISVLIFTTVCLFGFEPESTEKLLYNYLENDTTLKNLTLEAEKAELNLKSTKIENGFNVSLSTGNIVLKTSETGSSVEVSPSVEASLPLVSNLSVNASSDISITTGETTDFEDTSLGLSLDILSSSVLSAKITVMKAERTLYEAQQNLKNQALASEAEFYTELKALLNSTATLISKENDFYSDKMDFEETKAKGYSESSSTYRLAQMEVISDQHEIEKQTRTLIHDYVVFYKKCGFDISLDEKTDFSTLLPADIKIVEPVEIEKEDEEKYSEIESAVWTNKINSLSRKTDRFFTLTADGGYTFNNSNTNSDTIDAGISSKIGGAKLGAAISFPVSSGNNGDSPVYTFSASVNPAEFFTKDIATKTNSITENQEILEIKNAHTNYDTKVVDSKQDLEDLIWEKQSYTDELKMYEDLSSDLGKLFQNGFISESEYLSAFTNMQLYKVKLLINQIDLIIYNDTVKQLFVD